MRIFVIGHTGFIGKTVYEKLCDSPHELIGVNSQFIEFKDKGLIPRRLSIAEDLETLLQSDSIILNTAWCTTDREFRDSDSHLLMAESEISLIKRISELNLRYVSLGSIAEISDLEITDAMNSGYAINKRRILEFLQQNLRNFAWMRIASCFGENDKRNWFINELKNSDATKPIVVNSPDNLINLSSVENISSILIGSLTNTIDGEINLMDKSWYKIGDLVTAFYYGVSLDPITRLNGHFSEHDPNRILTGDNDVLGFLRKSRS